MTDCMSLFQIEQNLADLMALRETDELTAKETEACDAEIRKYVEQEIRKVDGIRAYLRMCEVMIAAAKQEAGRQLAHAAAWEAQHSRLLDACKRAMQMFELKRVDGSTGSILLKTNGGKQSVTIVNQAMVPDEFCQWEGRISAAAYRVLKDIFKDETYWLGREDVQLERIPRKALIEAELQKPCATCQGSPDFAPPKGYCGVCGGSGKRGVPGCRLEERGQTVIIT